VDAQREPGRVGRATAESDEHAGYLREAAELAEVDTSIAE